MNNHVMYKPTSFFIIAFLITWICEFIAAFFSYQEGMEGLQTLFIVLGILGPVTATIIMFYRSNNPELWRDYFDRLVNIKRINPVTIPVILFLSPVVILVSILISLLFGKPVDQFAILLEFGFSAGFMPVLLILILAPALEEMGWRGYGMDSLRSRFNLFTASLWFGLLWGLWHLPLYFVNHYYHHELLSNWVYAGNFMVSVFPMAFIINWLYYRNNRSIIACFLFHLSVDISSEVIQAEQFTKCIVTGILILIVVVMVLADRNFFFKEKIPYPV